MPADWFCIIDGKREGPMSSAQLKELALTGHLLPKDPVWKQGMQGKVPAKSVKGLFDRAPVAVPENEDELIEFEMAAPEEGEEVVEFEMVEEAVEEEEEKPRPAAKQPPREKKQEEAAEAKAAAARTAPTAGKPFRVMRGTQVRGPFSLAEVRVMLASGKISGSDLIGVETWLPAATLVGLAGTKPAAPRPGPVEEPKGDNSVGGSVGNTNEGEAIPVDDEFQL